LPSKFAKYYWSKPMACNKLTITLMFLILHSSRISKAGYSVGIITAGYLCKGLLLSCQYYVIGTSAKTTLNAYQ
jgi:hypothetical protein